MNAPNVNALWGRAIMEELAHQGVESLCVAPGSRSTPLVVAAAAHAGITIYSHFDERSAAYFALGRAKVTGHPTPVVCTSGTATANLHPAAIEADRARVPMLLLTADRPPELLESGANQTIDQHRLYGGAMRWARTLPEPAAESRRLRMLRTTVARAVTHSSGSPPGPVHLNIPFSKPLEPVPTETVPDEFTTEHPRAAQGRSGPYVRSATGRPTLDSATIDAVASAIEAADRGVIVVGPRTVGSLDRSILELAERAGFPVLADPLSGLRFGPVPETVTICGGYDGYLHAPVTATWPDPEIVLRFGVAPTSAVLREYLERVDARTYLVGPVGCWEDPTFTVTDHLQADQEWLAAELAGRVETGRNGTSDWQSRVATTESRYWELVDDRSLPVEGAIVKTVLERAPVDSTVFVSNSMPIRDVDRFGRPAATSLSILGNRGASGIDGITSSALGAASAIDGELILLTGDLAFYHDMNGLLALDRCNVQATIVLINNDGGGIFHMLPISAYDPPFTEQFKTPHGLDFSPTEALYDLAYSRVSGERFADAFGRALDSKSASVVEVRTDAEQNHRDRASLEQEIVDTLT